MKRKGHDGYGIGPKFGEYLEMNLQLVRVQYIVVVIGSLAMLTGEMILVLPGMAVVCGCIFSVFAKLFSETLYHKQACLYQSVPVSAFETALAKTIAGTAAPLLTVLIYVGGNLLLIDSEGDTGLALYRELLDAGYTVENMGLGMVAGILNAAVVPFVTCGMILFAVAVGNRLRENRDKSPKKGAIFLVFGLMIAAQYGITWIIQWMPLLSVVQEQITCLLFDLLCAAGMLLVNTWVLERWYSA